MFAWRNHLKTLLNRSGNKNIRSLNRPERCLHKTSISYCKDEKGSKEDDIAGSVSSKYEVFDYDKSQIIFDIEQEREKFYEVNDESEQNEKKKKSFYGISPTRGETGVIDVHELVKILDKENARDIVVIKIPEEYAYVDYFVITTGRSLKQMNAIAEYVRRVYKYKTNSKPGIPEIEGKESNDWKALDLGNIALHIMSQSAREYYDLELLWSVGTEYDKKCNMADEAKDYGYATVLSQLMSASNTS